MAFGAGGAFVVVADVVCGAELLAGVGFGHEFNGFVGKNGGFVDVLRGELDGVKQDPGTAGVRETEKGSLDKGRGEFSVMYIGTADALADQLGGKKFQGKKLSVTGVGNNTLEVTLGK